ncbi:MAG TPA: hypothetical protein VN903_22300 [Polyangia bacterium]|jgi:hypothetical protein|nr:hypothetical protein [Polyangia bacterium]
MLRTDPRHVFLLLAICTVGCGKSTQARRDGGDTSLPTPDAIAGALRSFDVVAVLQSDGGSPGVPATNRFTLVLDVDAGLVIAGGEGLGAAVPVTTKNGRSFHSGGGFAVGEMGDACSGVENVAYDVFDIEVGDGTLTGTATGKATVSCGDCAFLVPISATFTGSIDKTLPTLRGFGSTATNPYDGLRVLASEPLPTSATAKLRADDGATIDLVPQIVDGPVPLIVSFTKPDVVLRAGQGYVVTLDGLVDFAGQSDRTGPPLRITSFPPAPTVSEDGFESVTGSELGGAMVMKAGSLPAISGSTSLYVGVPGAPGLDTANGRTLSVKLARQTGDTTLRFAYRIISQGTQPNFQGLLRVGSEGASAGQATYTFPAVAPTETLTVGGGAAYASAVGTMALALPPDATDEVLVVVQPITFTCGRLLPGTAGLLIDDLRLE